MKLPSIYSTHGHSNIIVANALSGLNGVLFSPVRAIRSGTHVCSFCDTSEKLDFLHTKTARAGLKWLHSNRSNNILNDIPSSDEEEYDLQEGHSFNEEYNNSDESLSSLPLSPVNCDGAVLSDVFTNQLIEVGEPFVLYAEPICHCGFSIDPESVLLHIDGVLMSTAGPCSLHVQSYRCKNPVTSHNV